MPYSIRLDKYGRAILYRFRTVIPIFVNSPTGPMHAPSMKITTISIGLLLLCRISLTYSCTTVQIHTFENILDTDHFRLTGVEAKLKTNESSSQPPIDLRDICYDGTWEEFCDVDQTNQDYAFYPNHILKSLRLLICEWKEENKISCMQIGPFAAYKYCELMRSWPDNFVEQFIAHFTDGDAQKKSVLLSPGPGPFWDTENCYRLSVQQFNETCIDHKNPFFKMFLPLLGRVCTAHWFTLVDILGNIIAVCKDNRLGSDIEWNVIINSINCRNDKS